MPAFRSIRLNHFFSLFIFATLCFTSCTDEVTEEVVEESMTIEIHSQEVIKQEIPELEASSNLEDELVNDYLHDELQPIRQNFKRINSITVWTTQKEDTWDSTEGGEVTFFYLDEKLEKIIKRAYGETFQMITEYYLLNGQLSFVFEKKLEYNRPIYYDSLAMVENGDDEFFDLNKSEIWEDRSYFINEKLVHQISNQDCGSPFTQDYLEDEQKRLISEFKGLIDKTN